jgi:hypothetical protein
MTCRNSSSSEIQERVSVSPHFNKKGEKCNNQAHVSQTVVPVVSGSK